MSFDSSMNSEFIVFVAKNELTVRYYFSLLKK